MRKNKLWLLLFAMLPSMLMAQEKVKFAPYDAVDVWSDAGDHSLNYAKGGKVDDDNTMYLINLGALKDGDYHYFLDKAGHWGVEGALNEVGFPIYLNYIRATGFAQRKAYYEFLTSDVIKPEEKNHIAWVFGGVGSKDNEGLMFDRRNRAKEAEKKVDVYSYWQVQVYQNGDKEKDGANIYNYISPGDDTGQYLTIKHDGTRRKYIVTLTKDWKDPYAKWAFVSRKKLREHFAQQSQSYTDFLDATFMLDDPSFSRNDANAGKWKVEPEELFGKKINFNNAKYIESGETPNYTVEEKDKEYTTTPVGGKTYYNTLYGSFFNAEMKNTPGKVYSQTNTPVITAGWYMLTAQGFYRPGGDSKEQNAFMFTEVIKKDGKELSESKIQNRKVPLPLYKNDLSPEDLTQSGIKFAENHENYSVKIMLFLEAGQTLRFGVELPKDKSTGHKDEWVVFDNFQLKYMSWDFLVSQEAKNKHFYDNDQPNPRKFKTMILERAFKENKWNTLVLPVSLNKDQVQTGFGKNVRIAKLSGLNRSRIEFETIDLDKLPSWESKVIEANVPYLIYLEDLGVPEGTTGWKIGSDDGSGYIAYKTTYNFYVFPQVSFDKNDAKEGEVRTDELTIYTKPFITDPLTASDYTYVMNNGKLIRLTKGKNIKMKGLRWYLNYTSKAAARSAHFAIDNEEQDMDETSGIEGTETASEKKSSAIYTINGIKLNAEDTKALPSGIYVVDGKKVAVY